MLFENEGKSQLTTKEWIALTALCVGITVPFLVIMQDMSESLRTIANKL